MVLTVYEYYKLGEILYKIERREGNQAILYGYIDGYKIANLHTKSRLLSLYSALGFVYLGWTHIRTHEEAYLLGNVLSLIINLRQNPMLNISWEARILCAVHSPTTPQIPLFERWNKLLTLPIPSCETRIFFLIMTFIKGMGSSPRVNIAELVEESWHWMTLLKTKWTQSILPNNIWLISYSQSLGGSIIANILR